MDFRWIQVLACNCIMEQWWFHQLSNHAYRRETCMLTKEWLMEKLVTSSMESKVDHLMDESFLTMFCLAISEWNDKWSTNSIYQIFHLPLDWIFFLFKKRFSLKCSMEWLKQHVHTCKWTSSWSSLNSSSHLASNFHSIY